MKKMTFLFSSFLIFLFCGTSMTPFGIRDAGGDTRMERAQAVLSTDRTSRSFEEELPEGFHVAVSKDVDAIMDTLSRYTLYRYDTGSNSFYVADVLDGAEPSLLEAKAIMTPGSYDFYGMSDLSSSSCVIETIEKREGGLYQTFFPIPSSRLAQIEQHVSPRSPDEETYSRMLYSLNVEANYKSSVQEPEIAKMSADDNESDFTGNQSLLDDYLQNMDRGIEAPSLPFGSQLLPTSDDGIVNLIPKPYFQQTGMHQRFGLEWGYFINTYTDYGNNKISSVLIFDLEQIKANETTKDIVTVKNVLHKNYRYDYDFNVVRADVDNTYCIANPEYEMGLAYVDLADNQNQAHHPNPGASDYDFDTDYGYGLGNICCALIGQIPDTSNLEIMTKAAFFLGNLALGAMTSSLSTLSQFIIGTLYSVITDTIEEVLCTYKDSQYVSNGNNKYTWTDNTITSSTNFQESDKKKYASITPPKLKDSVLLFKDSTDSMSFGAQILSSELSDDYVALISHELKFEIRNDTGYGTATEIQSMEGEWSYLFGEIVNFPPQELKLSEPNYAVFGGASPFVFQFSPPFSGNYNLVFTQLPRNFCFSIDGETEKFGSIEILEPFSSNTKYAVSPYVSIKRCIHFSANKTYNISLWSESNLQEKKFGQAELSIYYANPGLPSFPTTGLKRLSQKIEYRGCYSTNHFYAPEDGLYTIFARPEYVAQSLDTTLMLLDSNYTELMSDDDSFGNLAAGFVVYLRANTDYFIVTGMGNPTSRTEFYLDVVKETYLPEIRKGNEKNELEIYSLRNKTVCFLIRQQSTKQIRFTVGLNYSTSLVPEVKLSVLISSYVLSRYDSDCIGIGTEMRIEANKVYFLELSCNDPMMYGGITLLFEGMS